MSSSGLCGDGFAGVFRETFRAMVGVCMEKGFWLEACDVTLGVLIEEGCRVRLKVLLEVGGAAFGLIIGEGGGGVGAGVIETAMGLEGG
jgi:hypothetical protein